MCHELAKSDVTEIISAVLFITVQLCLYEMFCQWRLELSRDNTKYPNGIDGRWQLAFSMAKMNGSPPLNTLRTEKVKVCPILNIQCHLFPKEI